MRILYICFDDLRKPGAWSVHVRAFVNGLARRGHDLRVAAPGDSCPPDLAAEFHPLPLPDSRAGRAVEHLAGSYFSLLGAARGFRPDLIYARGIHLTGTPVLLARTLGRPLVVEVNGLLEGEAPPWLRPAVRVTHRGILAGCRRVVTVTERLARALRRYGAGGEKVVVIPNGADPGRFRPGDPREARRKLGLPEAPTLVFAGSFYRHHALDLLPEFLTALRQQVPDARLLLVGEGTTRGEVEGRMKSEGLGSAVQFCGAVSHDRVPGYLQAAEVGLYFVRRPHPDFDFSPIKLYEYLSAGLPVLVGSDIPEICDFVRTHAVGSGTAPEAGLLAREAAVLLSDPERRKKMGGRGRTLIEERYSWERAVERLEEVLVSCVSRS